MRKTTLLFGFAVLIVILVETLVSQTKTFQIPDHMQSQALAISPDGNLLVYSANDHLYSAKTPDGNQAEIPIVGTETSKGAQNPVFSPDGRDIAFLSGSDHVLKRVAVRGGMPFTICKTDNVFGMSWSADNQIVYAEYSPQFKGIKRVLVSGGAPETVVTLKANEIAIAPQVLPGTESLLFTLATIPQGPASVDEILDKAQIVIQSMHSDERKVLRTSAHDARYVPTGQIAYMSGGELMSSPFNLKQLEISGPPASIAESVLAGSTIGTTQFAFSSAGTLAYIPAPAAEYELAYMGLDGTRKAIGAVPNNVFAPRVSPDGKQLTIDTSAGKDSAVWLVDLTGPVKMRRFTMDGENHYPIWSPDGQRLLFISVRNGQPAIYSQLANGSGTAEKLTETARAPENYSAVNQTLSFITLNTDGGNADYDVWTYSFKDKKAAPLIQVKGSAQHSSRFSPDGKWIAYVSDETGRLELYVQPYPITGARFQITKNGGGHPLWSLDGKTLYFDNSAQMYSVAVQTQPGFSASEPVPLPIRGFIQGQGNNRRQYDMMPDGKQFLMMFSSPQEIRVR